MATPRLRPIISVSTALLLAAGLSACLPGSETAPEATTSATAGGTTEPGESSESKKVRAVVHDSFSISDELVASFEKSSGFELELVTNGDGGALVNKLILTKDAPLGDVAFGVDNTFASRALKEGVFEDYTSANQGTQGAQLRLPEDTALTAVDFGDVCLNEDTNYFASVDLVEPLETDGFFNPLYADKLVVTNPATSTPGLSFLFATIAKYGEDGYLDYWKQLKDNGLKIVDGWEDAYYVDFTPAGGSKPLVLSYASSPGYTITEDGSMTTTASLLETCFRQTEYAGVLAGADNPEGAQAFIDFLLTDEFQSSIAETLYMYPVSDTAELPEAWAKFAPVPQAPHSLDPALIDQKREQWIKEWSAEILG